MPIIDKDHLYSELQLDVQNGQIAAMLCVAEYLAYLLDEERLVRILRRASGPLPDPYEGIFDVVPERAAVLTSIGHYGKLYL